jgi:hypothetical protein
MKQMIKSLISNQLFDFIFSIIIVPAAYCLLLYRRLGSSRLPKSTAILKKIGIFPIRNHYYEPLFNDSNLTKPLDVDRNLPGINLNDDEQIKLLTELTYAQELIDMNLSNKSNEVKSFYIKNGSFESGDAEFLYQLIRKTKPSKVIEIGSGSSTKIARLALLKNKDETGKAYSHICIEPYEQPWLEKLSDVKVIRKKVEDVNFDWASELKSGDILFVDSSHMIRPQGDVLKEYLEIFPSLSPGVYVHIHDIFTPKDYLKSWVVDDVRFWNEQYLLEALLSNTNRYKVVAALNNLKHKYYSELKKVCPYLSEDREPGSFYFKTTDNEV